MTTLQRVNLTSAEFKANPYAFYAWLRAEAPVYQTVLPDKREAWFIARYDDVVALLKDERFVKNRHNVMTDDQLAKEPWMPAAFKAVETNMLGQDGEDHARLRGLVHKAFTPRLIEDMRVRIQTITDNLLDAAQPKGQMDLIHDFALPIPVTVIAEMLGIPKQDQHKFHRWSNAMLASTAGGTAARLLVVPNLLAFMSYIRRLIKLRRMPDVRLSNPTSDIRWRKGIMLRGLQALPVVF